MDAAARECGYLKTLPPFLTEDDIDDVPDDNVLLLITGSQGLPLFTGDRYIPIDGDWNQVGQDAAPASSSAARARPLSSAAMALAAYALV